MRRSISRRSTRPVTGLCKHEVRADYCDAVHIVLQGLAVHKSPVRIVNGAKPMSGLSPRAMMQTNARAVLYGRSNAPKGSAFVPGRLQAAD
jgi:hypothetical protein